MNAIQASIRKELRALLPVWAACMAALVAATRVDLRLLPYLSGMIFVFGCLAIGAQSMGHEYTHRTIGLLLTQPIPRRRILLVKTAVLAVVLAAFAALAFVMLAQGAADVPEAGLTPMQALTITVMASLFITPYLTIVCRSGVAGLVFTGGVAVIAGTIFSALFARQLGDGNGSVIHPVFWWPGMLVLSALAAIDGWRLFTRLEAKDGRGRALHLPFATARPDRAAGAVSTQRDPMMWLLRKELRLQQMSFVVAGIWAAGLGAIYVRSLWDPRFGEGLMPLAFMAMGTVPLVTGALASAEERQLGTLEWQQLLPMAASRQWTVKAGVVIALSLLLGIGIPAIALGLAGEVGNLLDWMVAGFFVLVIAITALYVSSLSGSAIRAVILAVCVLTVASVTIPWMIFAVLRSFVPIRSGLPVPLALAILALPLLYFALRNHQSAERPVDQLRWQAGWIAGAAGLLLFLVSA